MFDIIIDDGSHYMADQQKSFETSGIFAAQHSGFRNSTVRSPSIPLLSPGVATSGTATVKHTARYFGASATTISVLKLQTFMDI